MRPAAPDSVMSTFSGLVAIEAPHFTAGIVIDCDRVKKAPLWLRYMECWTFEQLQKFVQDQHWKMVELERYIRRSHYRSVRRRMLVWGRSEHGMIGLQRRSRYG
jgi:hypothetical protein